MNSGTTSVTHEVNFPWPNDSGLSLQRDSRSPLPTPPALLHLEDIRLVPPAHFGVYRVGMVVFEVITSRDRWMRQQPWRSPSRTIRMTNLVTQLLERCDTFRLSLDLMIFPAGTLNFYGNEPTAPELLNSAEVTKVLHALRRVRQTVGSIAFGVNVQARTPSALLTLHSSEPELPETRTWRSIVCCNGSGSPYVLERDMGMRRLCDVKNGGSGLPTVVMAGKKVYLSLDEDQFEHGLRVHGGISDEHAIWLNPIQINHAGGGASAGTWPIARVATALAGMQCPIFLPHYRRSRLDGPFWFAGHPSRSRVHRWQPSGEICFTSQDIRVQLLIFDLDQ